MNLFTRVSIHKSNQVKKFTLSFKFVVHSAQFLAVPVLFFLPPGRLILEFFNFNYKFQSNTENLMNTYSIRGG